MSAAVQESVCLRQLISELTDSSLGINPVLIYEDNQAAIAMAKNPQFHGRAKHIEIKHHFIRDQVARGIISSVSRKSLRQRSLGLSDILVAFGAFLAFHQVDYIASATV